MLSWKQRRAVKLMFQKSDDEVAEEVGVKLKTVARWRRMPEFREALVAEEKLIRASAARIASDASLEAARNLHKIMAEGKDGKLSLDILKASGAFEEREADAAEALEDVMQKAGETDATEA